MFAALGFPLFAFMSTARAAQCTAGQVMGVEHGRDYVLSICGAGVVALRGVEPPLRSANVARPPIGGGELLGSKNVGPEAVALLSKIIGQRVTLVFDGYRIGDLEGRRYAYVYLPDKTFVNTQMIRQGYGYADPQGSHPRRDEFLAIEASARRLKLGVWGS
ncbi:MAG TPA: thermonuclease family protein [Vicinamibacterales bacterium]|nr:thermonuclease family protein [Vicinamibacterales bacterium]